MRTVFRLAAVSAAVPRARVMALRCRGGRCLVVLLWSRCWLCLLWFPERGRCLLRGSGGGGGRLLGGGGGGWLLRPGGGGGRLVWGVVFGFA